MPITDEKLEQKKAKVAELRQQVADAKITRTEEARSRSNDSIATALDAEQARLEAELAVAKRGNVKVAKAKSIKSSATTDSDK